MLSALLFAVSLAAEPAPSQPDPWSAEALASRPLDPKWARARTPRSKLHRTSRDLLISGGVVAASAVPIGLLTTGIAFEAWCGPESFECWAPQALGASVGAGMVLVGLGLATSGGIGFAVDASRKAHARRMELSIGVGPSEVVLAGRF